MQRSLATVVAGGLFLATLLTLFIIPTFYFVIERAMLRRSERRTAVAESPAKMAVSDLGIWQIDHRVCVTSTVVPHGGAQLHVR